MFFGYDFCEEKKFWVKIPLKKRMGFFVHTPSGVSAVCKQTKGKNEKEDKRERREKGKRGESSHHYDEL